MKAERRRLREKAMIASLRSQGWIMAEDVDAAVVKRVQEFFGNLGYEYDEETARNCAACVLNGVQWTQRTLLGDIVLTKERLNG